MTFSQLTTGEIMAWRESMWEIERYLDFYMERRFYIALVDDMWASWRENRRLWDEMFLEIRDELVYRRQQRSLGASA